MREQLSVKELKNKCIDLKKHVVDMIYKAQSGHPGGSLSVAEFVTACYWHEMDVDPQNPRWPDRDRFVLSKGHVCPAQYAALAMKGVFPMEVLDTLRKEGSPLQGHPSMNKCPGIDISTGSLGQGLACAVGMALAAVVLFLWQGGIYGLTMLAGNVITDSMMVELSIVGGFLIAMSGLAIMKVKDFKPLNFLPALIVPVVWCLIRG